MTKPRVHETDNGIQGADIVAAYDIFQRTMRDRGWIETGAIIKAGIVQGSVLELGPGPGYLGLEWLRQTDNTTLTGLDISPDMIDLAQRNAAEYGLAERATYVQTTGAGIPFDANTFDGVLSNGSLHEWEDPKAILDEMWRVLKPGGRLFVSDLRRDMFLPIRWFLWISVRPKEIRPGFITSVNAAYTPPELQRLVAGTTLKGCSVSGGLFGLQLEGQK